MGVLGSMGSALHGCGLMGVFMEDHRGQSIRLGRRLARFAGVATVVFLTLVAEPLLYRLSADPPKARLRKPSREPSASTAETKATPVVGAPASPAETDSAPPPTEKVASKTGEPGGLAKTAASEDHALAPVLELARKCQKEMDKVADYRCLFAKRERFGNRLEQQTMDMLCRHEPFSVYFKFAAPNPGRQVLFVTGQNRGNLLVREGGFKSIVGTLEFQPTNPTVLAENHYPVTQAGMKNMITTLVGQWEKELLLAAGDVTIEADVKLGDASCTRITTLQPRPSRDLRYHKTVLYIENARSLPVRAEQFGFPQRAGTEPPLFEEYTFYRIETNVGLGARDFDRNNRAYGL
jgi:hypothetical protein